MRLEVKIPKLQELERRLGEDLIDQPETEAGLDTIEKRLVRGGKGVGSRINKITTEKAILERVIRSTSRDPSIEGSSAPGHRNFNPRVTGSAWRKKKIQQFKAMAPNVARSIARKVNERISKP